MSVRSVRRGRGAVLLGGVTYALLRLARKRSGSPPRKVAGARNRKRMPDVRPLVDAPLGAPVYSSEMLGFALIGAVVGGLLLGLVAWGLAAGVWPVAGLGQIAAAGVGAPTFTGAGVGVAVGALVGGLAALARLPRAARSGERKGTP